MAAVFGVKRRGLIFVFRIQLVLANRGFRGPDVSFEAGS